MEEVKAEVTKCAISVKIKQVFCSLGLHLDSIGLNLVLADGFCKLNNSGS